MKQLNQYDQYRYKCGNLGFVTNKWPYLPVLHSKDKQYTLTGAHMNYNSCKFYHKSFCYNCCLLCKFHTFQAIKLSQKLFLKIQVWNKFSKQYANSYIMWMKSWTKSCECISCNLEHALIGPMLSWKLN